MKKINLIEMLQGCSKRNGMTVRQSNPDGETTVNRQSRLMSHRGYLRNLAMIFAVLVLSIGQMWGAAVTWDFTNRSAATLSNGSSYSYMATDGTTEMRYSAGSSDAIVAKDKSTDGYLKENGKTGSATVKDIDGKTDLGKTRLIRLFVSGKGTLRINCNGTNGEYVVKNGSTSGTTLVASLSANTTSSEINVTTSPIWIETTTKGYINSIVWTPSTGSTWFVKGDWNEWGTSTNLTGEGTTLTATATLSANTQYEFKVHNTSGDWHTNTGTIKGSVTNWDFSTTGGSGNNCHIRTSCAGTYTFTYNTSTNKLSVAYPESHKVYFTKDGASWSKVYAYCFNGDGWDNGWPGYEITSNTEDHCGTEYYAYTDGYTKIIFNNGTSGVGNQTGDITVAGYEGMHAVGAAATGWTAYPTYTVTYNGNEKTGGSVPTDGNSPYACSSTVTVLGNTGSLVKTGYNFTGWNTAPNGSGAGYTAGNTFTISANTTLYAQWELIPTYDVIYNINGGTGGSTATQEDNDDGSQVTTSANGFTKTGYKFKWWNTAANGGGEDFYPGEKVTIDGADVNLYAQWEQVADNQEFWTPIDEATKVTNTAISKTAGDMSITSGGATDAADINVDVSNSACVVNKYNSSVDKHAKVLALKADDKYIEIHFTDGSPINKLWLGATPANTDSKNIVVVYSATSDFTTAGGAAHEFKKVGSTDNLVALPGNTQATKSVTDVSPSTENTYYYARIYRRITTANTVFDNTTNLGSGTTTRIYSIKAQKGLACVAPTAVNITGTYHYFPGETISLNAAAEGGSGTPTTYQWYKGGTADGNIIEGATSATYTKENCTFADAGSYYCKVTRGGSCSTFSGNYDVKILHLYVNTGRNGTAYGDVDFVKVDATTARATISLGANWDYGFNIADGCGHYYGNTGSMNESNCTGWTMNVDGTDCLMRTTNGATYTFTVDYTTLTAPVVSITYPSANQAADKVIYFDNNDRNWSTLHYRIGRTDHTQATAMTQVHGTANLYKVTTAAYNNFTGWHIANNAGWTGDNNSIYRTYTDGDEYSITYATAHEGGAVTESAVTVTPTTSRGNGSDAGINDNCEFYNYEITNGMKTRNVAITAPSNGTITVAYTDVAGESQSFTSGNRDLAHTVIITPTATPNTGYALSSLTVNEAAHTSGTTYTVTANTTIAATFSPASYTVTLHTNDGTINAGNVTSYTYGTGATLPTDVTKSGFTFDGWYDNSGLTGSAVTTISTTATGNKEYWAKWTEDAGGCPTEITGGTVYKLQIKTGLTNGNLASTGTTTLTIANYLSEAITNGSASVTSPSAGNAAIADTKAINLANGSAYITLDLDCPIQEHDIIKYTITQQNGGLYKATSRSDGNLLLQLPKTSNSSTIGQIEVTSGSKLIGKTTLYLFAKSNGAYNYYFEIIRPLKITLDATTNGGTAVDPVYGATDDKVVLPHAFKSGSRFNGWYTAASGGTKQADYYTITTGTTLFAQFTAGCAVTGTMFSLSFPSSLYPASNTTVPANSSMNLLQYATITGGAAIAENTNSSAKGSMQTNGKFVLDDVKVCVHITLDCPLQLNDVISTTIETQNLSYTATSTRSTTNYFTKGTNQTTTITADHVLLNSRDIYIWTHSSSGGKLISINISRPVGTKYSVTYDGNDKTSGSVPTDDNEYDPADEVTTAAQGSLAKTNYTFGGWNTANDGTGTNTAAGSTFSITDNTTLYAKWTQAVTLDANTANHGSTDGSATAVWNATGLTGITHATPVSGYKLTGYYTTDSGDGVKVLNSDGSFASSNVTDYITSGKWSRTDEAPTLYARYESSGALIWNLGVNTEATSLTTSSKESSFTQIAVANMGDATLSGSTYAKSAKSSLTGKISSPATKSDYVYVTFKVAAGYKFTPSNISVKVQPVGNGEHKNVELLLTDESSHNLASASATKCDGTTSGKTTTVSLAGNSTFFTGNVTLKIYVYDFSGLASGTYRLGTPITIEGAVEATCVMPSFTGLDYDQTSYTVDEPASAISVTGAANVDSYQWKYNTVNDRTSGTTVSTSNASYTPPTSEDVAGTRYYWCELTNTCGTVKTPAVGITVSATKSDATISWTGTSASANYGGGGYTVKATVEQTGWNGNAADLTLSAPAGIRIYNIVSGTADSKKYVQASFDVTTAFDRETYSTTIPFAVSADATSTYNAISDEEDVTFDACTGGGGSSEEYMPVDAAHIDNTTWKGGWVYDGIGMMRYSHGGSDVSSGNVKSLDHDMGAGSVITQYYKSSANHFGFYTEKAINGVRLYVYTSNDKSTVSGVYIANSAYTSGTPSTGAVTYEATYYNDDDGLLGATNDGCTWVEIMFDSEVAAGKYGQINLSKNVNIAGIAFISSSGSGAKLNTHLQWSGSLADGTTVNKKTTDAYFTYSASMITENTNSLGAITYSSSDPSVATVDATGKVAMVAAGTTTIKATLAASGCYKKAEISYTLNVTEEACAIAAGTLTLTFGSESKCSSDNVTLKLTGFESGATLQWKDGDTDIDNGGNYTIVTDGTTSTLTTNQPGTYSVIVTKGCFVRSNRITITNKSATVHVTRLVKEWYIKNGRLTPDIALWELGDDCSFVGVTASSGWDAGTDLTGEGIFYEKDGIVYLKGTEPKANAGAVQNYTLTLTVNDGCDNQTLDAEGKEITIHHQQNTDKHVLAFVVNGTPKGGFTDGITAAQTTSVGLYNAIAAQFDVQATNIYSTDDEQKLREYYSQYDILCITDYPNTKTKGVNSKSYVDAIGALIDIRPILTMEAYVSSLANWRAKGISGNPKSPTTRQYTMDLQCKDHEIFAGTDLTKVGEGDEAMYRVSMVDNTKEDYATLDATYGATLPHKEKESKSGAGDGEYNYGGKPALQGFTFTQEMSDNDLLPIGLIDDGAGNPLQVGIERQRNMEARLMVLGINSYAMERLTNDGDRVVINALNYLMKKNQEDIADCSTSFVGGAEGDTKNWDNKDNWTGNTVPLPTQKVRILADCEVSSTVYAQSVLIVTDGKYNKGSDVAKGKLTIKENGALIVGGKIQAASAPAYNRPRATTPDKLLIETSSTNQAALIFDNEEAETQATVNLYSLGKKPSNYEYQYFAVPMEVVPVNPTFANETHGTGIYTYVYNEATSGWERRRYYDDLFAFEGLGITTKSATAMEYEMTGTLASTATKEITLTHDGAGLNLIGNSWMAPIQIGALAEDNAGLDNQTVYIYCAGRDAEGGAVVSSDDTETAGQWLAVPFEAASFATWKDAGKLSVIPAMQAFQIKVSAEATLTLDYKKVVRGSTNDLNAKLRAPGRRMAANEVTMTNIRVADSKTHTDLSLFEGDRFSDAFDNGWEAEYMNGDDRSAKLYAETEAGQMAVAAMYDYEGTVVGFAPGKETEYTFSFMGEDNGYYLNDIKLKNSVRISEGETYTFTYEDGDTANRFYISRTAINAPAVTTGMENLNAAAPRVQKIIYNDKLYIIRGGRLYDATGKVVK